MVTALGIVIVFNLVSWNARSPIVLIPSGSITSFSFVPSNALSPIVSSLLLLPIVIFSRVEFKNADESITLTESGTAIDDIFALSNALNSMLSIESGKTIDLIILFANA